MPKYTIHIITGHNMVGSPGEEWYATACGEKIGKDDVAAPRQLKYTPQYKICMECRENIMCLDITTTQHE